MPIEPLAKPATRTPLAASFHLSLVAAWAAIAVLWIITPLCYLYVIWTLLTLIPELSPGRPAPSGGAFRVLHYLVLAYCAFEIPFSIVYRVLAIRANARRPSPQYSRQFLRSVFKRSLENGMDLEDAGDEILEEMAMNSHAGGSNERDANAFEMRQRRGQLHGDGSLTPDLSRSRQLHDGPDDDEGYGESTRSSSDSVRTTRTGAEKPETARKRTYAASFLQATLQPDDPRAIDFRTYIAGWFGNCDFDEIYRLDMTDWLAWSLYAQPLEELLQERKEWEAAGKPQMHLNGEPDIDHDDELRLEQDKLGLVEHCVELVEARAARVFPEGRNPAIKVIRLTLDPVRVASRPFILYCFVWTLQKIITASALYKGFKEVHDGDTRYLVRIPPNWTPHRKSAEANRPLLFIHGLGMGVTQYATLLGYLCNAKTLQDRPIVVLIQPHISMSLFARNYLNPPNQATSSAGIGRLAERWGFDKTGFTILSHSNGSIVHGWLVKDRPDLAVRSCFVDAVCFCLWEPWVCYNFLYSSPKTPIEYLMRYFVSRELGVALMLQRSFDWSSNLLFPTDIPNLHSPHHTSFFLAGRDSILNAERVRRYLRRHGVQEAGKGQNVGPGRGGLKLHHGKAHGESMIGSGLAFNQIMAWVTAEEGESETLEGESSATSSG